MSIVSIKEDWKGETRQMSIDENRSRPGKPVLVGEHTRTFDIDFDEGLDTRFNKSWFAERAYMFFRNPDGSTLPAPFETLGDIDPWCYVDRYAVQGSGPLSRRVTVIYKSFVDPLTLPIEKRIYFKAATDILDHAPLAYSNVNLPIIGDQTKKPILNSAGEPLDPAVTTEVNIMVMQFRYWKQKSFQDVAHEYSGYKGSVNATNFYGYAAGLVKCTTVQTEEKQVGTGRYWDISIEFEVLCEEIDPIEGYVGWMRRFCDQGFRVLARTPNSNGTVNPNGAITGITQILDSAGNPVSRPKLLDGKGNELTLGARPWSIYVQDFKWKDFTPLGLGGTG